jgi:CubicO group peptidase (beta-lactamase class C family)
VQADEGRVERGHVFLEQCRRVAFGIDRDEDDLQPRSIGTAGEYNWGGAGGTAMWVDPVSDLITVFMMQSPKQRVLYRPILRNLVYGALTEPK